MIFKLAECCIRVTERKPSLMNEMKKYVQIINCMCDLGQHALQTQSVEDYTVGMARYKEEKKC